MVKKIDKKQKKEEKLYVVRSIRETPYDEEFRIIGTKEEIADYVKNQVEFSYESRELRFKAYTGQRLFFVDFHCGSEDGHSGYGSSNVCKSIKEAKEWMLKYLTEIDVDAPQHIYFKIYPIYWTKKKEGNSSQD